MKEEKGRVRSLAFLHDAFQSKQGDENPDSWEPMEAVAAEQGRGPSRCAGWTWKAMRALVLHGPDGMKGCAGHRWPQNRGPPVGCSQR